MNANPVRYRRLSYLALNVSDLDHSSAFYRDVVGLQQVGPQSGPARYLRCSEHHHDIALFQGKPGVKRIAFELESAKDLRALKDALDGAGVTWTPIPFDEAEQLHVGEGLRFSEPTTNATMEFHLAGSCADEGTQPFVPTVAKILRLGHLVLRSARYEETVKFFTEVLNFLVSDSIDGAVTFLRCFPSPYHHSFGIGNGKAKGTSGFHHVAFMVKDVDDIGGSLWRLKSLDVPIVNGPGRHLPSGSMFLYYLDPDGLTLEYTLGMEEFPEHDPRAPRTLPLEPASFDIWRGPTDPRKAATGEIEIGS